MKRLSGSLSASSISKVDVSIQQEEKIAFNAGSLTDSIIMRSCDYLTVAGRQIFLFTQ